MYIKKKKKNLMPSLIYKTYSAIKFYSKIVFFFLGCSKQYSSYIKEVKNYSTFFTLVTKVTVPLTELFTRNYYSLESNQTLFDLERNSGN